MGFQPVPYRGPIYSAQGFNISGAQTVDFGEWITSADSVYFSLFLSTGVGVTVTFTFYTDNTKTAFTARWPYTVTQGCSLSVVVPALANWLDITISTAQAGNQVGDYSVLPLAIGDTVQRYPTPQTPQSGNPTVPANTTVSYTLPLVIEGQGKFFCTPNDASGKLYVGVRELAEGNFAADYLVGDYLPAVNLQSISRDFIAGTRPIQVTIANTDTVPHACTFWVNTVAQ